MPRHGTRFPTILRPAALVGTAQDPGPVPHEPPEWHLPSRTQMESFTPALEDQQVIEQVLAPGLRYWADILLRRPVVVPAYIHPRSLEALHLCLRWLWRTPDYNRAAQFAVAWHAYLDEPQRRALDRFAQLTHHDIEVRSPEAVSQLLHLPATHAAALQNELGMALPRTYYQ